MMPLIPNSRAAAGRTPRRPWRPACELLECRLLMADFTLYGTKWPDPSHITYSLAGDGAPWDGSANVLNNGLTTALGSTAWQRDLARALQTWASSANINIVRHDDGAYAEDINGAFQSDPRFGDIRFGAIDLNSATTLAQTYFPPLNGITAAGDVTINTSIPWSRGDVPGRYDLFSVLLHETGHSLGLDHAKNPGPVMYFSYGGYRTGLTADDIAGIQAIYGPRTPDAYRSSGHGQTFGYSIDLTSDLNASAQGTLSGLSLSTIGDTEYFTVVVPPNANGATLQVQAVATGVSLLSPKISVYDPQETLLGSAANPSDWGNTVTAQATGVLAGKRYLVAVTGATGDVFAVGAYSLNFSFPGAVITPPTAPPPPTSTPSPPPITLTPPPIPSPFSPPTFIPVATLIPAPPHVPNNSLSAASDLGVLSSRVSSGPLSLLYATDVAFFTITTGKSGVYQANANGTAVQIFDSSGRLITQGRNSAAVKVTRAGVRLYVAVDSLNGAPVSSYTLTMMTQNSTKFHKTVTPKAKVARQKTSPPAHWSATTLHRPG